MLLLKFIVSQILQYYNFKTSKFPKSNILQHPPKNARLPLQNSKNHNPYKQPTNQTKQPIRKATRWLTSSHECTHWAGKGVTLYTLSVWGDRNGEVGRGEEVWKEWKTEEGEGWLVSGLASARRNWRYPPLPEG